MIFSAGATSGANVYAYWNTTNTLSIRFDQEASGNVGVTAAVNRDPSAWYHVVFALDTTQATAANRVKIYINGVQQDTTGSTFPSQNFNTAMNNNVAHNIGRRGYDATSYASCLLSEIIHVDGQQLTPSSFGETDSATGVWKPKAYSGTYGTNGFELNFSDNSNTTAATLGKDSSGNSNNWTPNNFSVTAGVGNDSLVDSPTAYGTDTGVGGEVRGNYCTLNPLDEPSTYAAAGSSANGNLDFSVSNDAAMGATFAVSSGKWYWEMTVVSGHTAGANTAWAAIASSTPSSVNKLPYQSGSGGRSYATTGLKFNENTSSSYGNTYTNGDVIGCALDLDNGKVYWSKNGTFQASGDPVAGTNAAFTGLTGTWLPVASSNTPLTSFNFGQRAFAYTAPSGFKALCTTNLPTPTIGATSTTLAEDYFNAVLYTGNGSTQSITGVGFQPDWVWLKSRSNATDHELTDAVRGATKSLISNSTAAEATDTNGLTAFNSDGFSLGTDANYNGSARTYVAWNWNAGGSTVTNTSGTISAQVRANTTSGFSIVTYTGTGSNATVGHGLGVAPSFIITKHRNAADGWYCYHASLGNNAYIQLSSTAARVTPASTYWQTTTPSSTVFSIGTSNSVNQNTINFVAYCFAPVAGYSAFGSYTGDGSTDGPFVFTNMRPRYLMIKNYTGAGNGWIIIDTARSTYNQTALQIYANSSAAEASSSAYVDILSNGFKLKSGNSDINNTGVGYIYMAFAETPAKFSLAR
jgi:hypothetical protein